MNDLSGLDESTYQRIAAAIRSDDSPVGIDAERTHVMILHKLQQIEERLARLEEKQQKAGERKIGNSP